MRFVFAITAAGFLSACTNTIDFKPTMASDPPQLGIEGIALATELSKAYSLQDNAICKNLKLGYQEKRKFTVSRYESKDQNLPEEFTCVAFVEKSDTEIKKAVKSHVQAGLALSDYFCDNFFERISEHAGKRKFARNTTNDVGALVSTVLGLASAGSAVTGGIGAGFGLLDGTWRNYDENFLVSADLPTLQRLVHSEQDKFRGNLTGAMPDNFPDATNTIIRYANLCSFVGMKRLLTESMGDKAQTNELATEGGNSLVKARAEEFLQAYDDYQNRRNGQGNDIAQETSEDASPAP